MSKMRVGIIGLGGQSVADHIPAVLASTDTELVAVMDIDSTKVESFVLNSNLSVKGYIDVDAMFKNEKLDFVIIALPHHLHYEYTYKAIRNKVHVLKEKPFAVSLKQAEEINSLAKEHGVEVMVTLQRRFNPIYSTLVQLLDKIGNIFFIDAKYTFFTNNPHEGWRGDKEQAGGGCIIDMGYHIIDLLMWYFGLPEHVFADMSSSAKEEYRYTAEDTADITFRYAEKDLWGTLLVSRVIPPKQEFLNIYGTRGYIHLERGLVERYISDGKVIESLSRENDWPSASQDQIEYFVKVIKGEKENIGKPEFHFNHLAFIEAAYESKKTGTYVSTTNFLK